MNPYHILGIIALAIIIYVACGGFTKDVPEYDDDLRPVKK